MNDFLGTFLVEIGFFTLLGVLYYFYQRKKIMHYEENKGPIIAGYILHSCVTERGESSHVELDVLIESLDDYLHNRTSTPPKALLKKFSESPDCSPELKAVIEEGLQELEQ